MPPPDPTGFPPELLMRHDRWLRALIRGLVDDGSADDVVQEVWRQAWLRPPRHRAAWPSWLATVARRVSGRSRRAAARRAVHEHAAAVDPAAAAVDPSELVIRVEERQRIARAVLELDEPFRTVVLLRYFEDQEPAAIARRLGIPAATVRTRLHRAHEQLRVRFERERGKGWRRELAALCVPLARRAVRSSPAAAVLAVAALMLVAIGWWLASADVGSLSGSSAKVDSIASVSPAGESADSSRSPVAASAPTDVVPAPAPGGVRVAGQLLDPHGRPIVGVPILWCGSNQEHSEQVARSAAGGYFVAMLPEPIAREAGKLVAGGDCFSLLAWRPESPLAAVDDALVVAAPRISVSGWVVDESGIPVANASVRCWYGPVVTFPLPTAGTAWEPEPTGAKTDATGWFRLEGVPGTSAADLEVDFSARRPMPETSVDDLRIVVRARSRPNRPPSAAEPWPSLIGTVRDAGGRPIEGAQVLWPAAPHTTGSQVVATGVDGSYQLAPWFGGEAKWPIVIVATAPGCDPEAHEVWGQPGQHEMRADFVLAPAQRTIRGRVVGADDRPRAGLVVALADPTPCAEPGSSLFVERPDRHEFGPHALTDQYGAFAIPGVLARPYRLRVFDAGAALTTDPVVPERPAELRFAVAPRHPCRIRVVDRAGRPVRGVAADVRVVRFHRAKEGFSTTSFLAQAWHGRTDEAGECSFASLPGGELRVRLQRSGWVVAEFDIGAGSARTIEHTLLRQCLVRVDARDFHGSQDEYLQGLILRDAAGNELPVEPAWRGGRPPASAWQFAVRAGRSNVVGVAETAAHAELRGLGRGQGALLRAMPLRLDPERIHVLDFPR